jgi:hypothetical protein
MKQEGMMSEPKPQRGSLAWRASHVVHARVPAKKDRRSGAAFRGHAVALCGEDAGSMDQTPADFAKDWTPEGWTRCGGCAAIVARKGGR